MGSEGQGWHNGGDGDDFDNVVRLPTDWIGPPEELVPIGPVADRTLSADSFWGADSTALHEAVRPPRISAGSPPPYAKPRPSGEEPSSSREEPHPATDEPLELREEAYTPAEEPLPKEPERRQRLVVSSLVLIALIAAGALVMLLPGVRAKAGSAVSPGAALTTAERSPSATRAGIGQVAGVGGLTAGGRTVNRAAASRARSRSGVHRGRRGTRRDADGSGAGTTGLGADANRTHAAATISGAGISVSTTSATTTPATESTSGTSDQSAGAVDGTRSDVGTAEHTTSAAGLPAPGGPPAP